MGSNFSFSSYGILKIDDMSNLTLKDVEEFCAEARRLGLGDNTHLSTSRQGLLGPVTGWYFSVPVTAKQVEN